MHLAVVVAILFTGSDFSGCVHHSGIQLQDVFRYHVLAVVAEEHFVDNHVGADFQFHLRVNVGGQVPLPLQRCAVTAQVHGTLDDGGMLGIRTTHEKGNLFGVGAEDIQCFDRAIVLGECKRGIVAIYTFLRLYRIRIIIIILEGRHGTQLGIVGVGVGAVAAAIDVAIHGGVDTYGIAAEDMTGDVVTAIDIDDVAAAYEGSCRKAFGEFVLGVFRTFG